MFRRSVSRFLVKQRSEESGERFEERGENRAKIGTDGLLTSVPFFAKTGILTRSMSG